jgi:hypothetical protein
MGKLICRNIIRVRCAMKKFVLIVSAVYLLLSAFPQTSSAVDIGIGGLNLEIGGPPPVEVPRPVELLPIPGRYVYFIPGVNAKIFFYHGRWYRLHQDRWFRSERYDGPWEHVRDIPPVLLGLPPDYRRSSARFSTIPYREVRNNWERWEQERRWSVPPPIEITGPLELLPIRGRYVYFIPGIDADIFFYRGMWYRPYDGRWFRSKRYDGPWEHIRDVPPALIDLPPDYRRSASRFDRIPYGEVRNNWERWEQERHWDRRRDEERHRYEERERHEGMEQYPGEREREPY